MLRPEVKRAEWHYTTTGALTCNTIQTFILTTHHLHLMTPPWQEMTEGNSPNLRNVFCKIFLMVCMIDALLHSLGPLYQEWWTIRNVLLDLEQVKNFLEILYNY